MTKSTSAGIIFLNNGNILLGHATGNWHWDIPKGMIEANETALQAAIRETKEETNIDVVAAELTDIGVIDYRRDKQLHLFRCDGKSINTDIFDCQSFFYNHQDILTPEIDDLQWFDINWALENRVAKNMKRVLSALLID